MFLFFADRRMAKKKEYSSKSNKAMVGTQIWVKINTANPKKWRWDRGVKFDPHDSQWMCNYHRNLTKNTCVIAEWQGLSFCLRPIECDKEYGYVCLRSNSYFVFNHL